jgi:hypothetical protein
MADPFALLAAGQKLGIPTQAASGGLAAVSAVR